MVFSSLTFLFCFLPVVLALYFLRRSLRWRNGVLLVASLFFYAWGEPLWILAMVGSALVNWFCAGMIASSKSESVRKTWLVIGVAAAGAMLFICKYSTFFINSFLSLFGADNLLKGFALPIGISFYTFQIITYTVDVYREETKPQKSFPRLLLYVSCFPQLIAGPIVRYSDVAQQIGSRETTPDDFAQGMQRFAVGLAKKVIFANICGSIMTELPLPGTGNAFSVVGAWYAAFVYAMQIYFDFSGYSDMAIGLGRILGFTYKENFEYPFISLSAGDFYRRWHISLGSWFREYLMYPLMRSRRIRALSTKKSKKHGKMYYRNLATILVTMIVWTCTGLWHGASWNFILWGVYFGLMMVLEKFILVKFLDRLPKIIRWVINMIVALFSFVIFYYTDMGQVGAHMGAMLGLGGAGFMDEISLRVIRTYSVFPLIAFIASMPLAPMFNRWAERTLKPKTVEVARVAFLSACFVLSVLFLVGQSFNAFIYFNF